MFNTVVFVLNKRGLSPGSHCWGYYPGALLCSQISETHWKVGHGAPVD